MGTDETVKELLETQRGNLAAVVKESMASPRPAGACASHDAMFAVQREVAAAMGLVLLVMEDTLVTKPESASTPAAVVAASDSGKVTPRFVIEKLGKTLVICVAATICVACVTGNMGEINKLIDKFKCKTEAVSAARGYDTGMLTEGFNNDYE